MPYQLNAQQMEAVNHLDAPSRYRHFLKQVTDWQELWSLECEDGFVGIGDDNGNEGIPFWPHPRYAEEHAAGEWAGLKPARISLSDFLESWLKGMQQDGVEVIVFPIPGLKGVVVLPDQLARDLAEECKQYE